MKMQGNFFNKKFLKEVRNCRCYNGKLGEKVKNVDGIRMSKKLGKDGKSFVEWR